MVVEASSTLLLRFITMELLSRCVVEFFVVVVVTDLFFQHNDYVRNQADLSNILYYFTGKLFSLQNST